MSLFHAPIEAFFVSSHHLPFPIAQECTPFFQRSISQNGSLEVVSISFLKYTIGNNIPTVPVMQKESLAPAPHKTTQNAKKSASTFVH